MLASGIRLSVLISFFWRFDRKKLDIGNLGQALPLEIVQKIGT